MNKRIRLAGVFSGKIKQLIDAFSLQQIATADQHWPLRLVQLLLNPLEEKRLLALKPVQFLLCKSLQYGRQLFRRHQQVRCRKRQFHRARVKHGNMGAGADRLAHRRRQHRRFVKRIAAGQQDKIAAGDIGLADRFKLPAGSPDPCRPVALRMAFKDNPFR